MSEVKHWTITTTLERTFTGTQEEAEQLQQEEREYYDSMVDGGDFCAYVVGSRIESSHYKYDNDGYLTTPGEPDIETDNAAQYGDHPLATGGTE